MLAVSVRAARARSESPDTVATPVPRTRRCGSVPRTGTPSAASSCSIVRIFLANIERLMVGDGPRAFGRWAGSLDRGAQSLEGSVECDLDRVRLQLEQLGDLACGEI